MGDADNSNHCHVNTTKLDATHTAALPTSSPSRSLSAVSQTLLLLQSYDLNSRVEAAKEIRRLTKTSQRYRRHFYSAVWPLVDMLRCHSTIASEAALAALLNLAVKDEKNKINIIEAGALKPIIGFLQSENPSLQEHAAAALITLSASSVNKPIISASGAIPLLIKILSHGSSHARSDAAMALYNLSTHQDTVTQILQAGPIPILVNLLKSSKKRSKIIEKCTALIESLVAFEEGRIALTCEEGGILAVVEVLEGGSRQSREHAVGALLSMCQSDRPKYRELILREGAIPSLLELTVQGTAKSRTKAQMLLSLLRDNPHPRSEICSNTLDNIVCGIISQFEGEEQLGKAKKMLAEMVQVSMEQSLRHLQKRAMMCTSADLPVNSCASDVLLN